MKKRLFGNATTHSRNLLRDFHKDESGSIIVFTLFILVLMLVVGGMAVDFMRFESRRALMQGTVDRAVLAAADLDQELDSAEVVKDYVLKADGEYCLDGEPIVDEGANFKSVTANCEIVLDTFFLKLIGIDTLTATAQATAIEGVGNAEVSLVVDLTGSMNDDIPGTSTPKIERLQEAATSFIDTLLQPAYTDKISLSLIPYTTQVNVGADLFDALGVDRVHGFSNCIHFADTEFDTTEWNVSSNIIQAQHFQYASNWAPQCRTDAAFEVIPISQNKTDFQDAIDTFVGDGGTGIYMGVKWGAALLDSSIGDYLADLPADAIETAFDDRPFEYNNSSGTSGTVKYLVVMTDGQNSWNHQIKAEAYNSPSEIAYWASNYVYNHIAYNTSSSSGRWDEYFIQESIDEAGGDTLMANVCTAAKEAGIIIYTVSMGADDHGQTQMSNCASSPTHFFNTSGDELVAIFEAIASQITDLRLTL